MLRSLAVVSSRFKPLSISPACHSKRPRRFREHPRPHSERPRLYREQPSVFRQRSALFRDQPGVFRGRPSACRKWPSVFRGSRVCRGRSSGGSKYPNGCTANLERVPAYSGRAQAKRDGLEPVPTAQRRIRYAAGGRTPLAAKFFISSPHGASGVSAGLGPRPVSTRIVRPRERTR